MARAFPNTKGPLRVVSVTPDTVVLDIENQRERLSRDSVVLDQSLSLLTPSSPSTHVGAARSLASKPPRPRSVPHPHRGFYDLPTLFGTSSRGIIINTVLESPKHSVASAKEGAPRASAVAASPEPRRTLQSAQSAVDNPKAKEADQTRVIRKRNEQEQTATSAEMQQPLKEEFVSSKMGKKR